MAVVTACGMATPAHAQSPPPAPAMSFLPRADFYFQWASLMSADPRFSWQGRIGMDIDAIDYGIGRLRIVGDYEGVLGSERQPLDLNHGNYMFDGSVSSRHRAIELAGVFHHESRHLADRENANSISWNSVGFRAIASSTRGAHSILAAFDAAGVRGQHYVDYTWATNLRVKFDRRLVDRAGIFAEGTGGLKGVDPLRAGRTQHLCGGRIEGGVRLQGRSGAAEIFAGYERRIDAYPLDRGRARWFTFGFRLMN
jgi:hypothetical protein